MSSTDSCTATTTATTPECAKCQKETAEFKDCAACLEAMIKADENPEKIEKSVEKLVEKLVEKPVEKPVEKLAHTVKMDLDRDLTTTETLDDELDELDELCTSMATKQTPAKQEQPQKQLRECKLRPEEHPAWTEPDHPTARPASPAETAAEADAEPESRANKMAATYHTPPAPRGGGGVGGKITRSSLNGSRSPQIIKRLRKSTRSTRFKSKLTARGAAAGGAGGGGGAAGHTGAGGGAAGAGGHAGASSSASGAGKAHGKLGSGGGSGGAGGGGGANYSPSGARNRRTLFKRPAQKTPRVQACTRFVKSVFYKGSYMQIGDIVSIVDSEHNVYYAQVRGLLVDAYCEKSAFLTWLIPTQDSPDPRDGFDPATYLIGPDEELSRKLSFLEFIMHAPSNYYFDRTTPFPLPDIDEQPFQRTGGFIWTRLPVIKRERERETGRGERVGKAAA